jgi:tRNA (guanine-N7-)-methyltransferase
VNDGPGEQGNVEDLTKRRIRSFVTRAGRISIAQQRAIDQLLPEFGVAYQDQLLDFEALFQRAAPVILEIGFGMGETTATLAAAHRELNFLGIEVHTPGVGALLKQIGELQLTNLRIIQHDAVEVLDHMVPHASLAGVHVFFPDPWHKARHHKRRLLQPPLVSTLVDRLKPNGFVHCATDWEDYAEQIGEVLSGEGRLERIGGTQSRSNPLIARPVTKFETRGRRLGHGVWDLIAVKRQQSPQAL